jgi:hypothetical protein
MTFPRSINPYTVPVDRLLRLFFGSELSTGTISSVLLTIANSDA